MTKTTRMRTALVASLALLVTGLGVGSAASADDAPEATGPIELLNEDFSDGVGEWWSYGPNSDLTADEGALCINSDAPNEGDAGLGLGGWTSVAGTATLTFKAKGEGPLQALVQVPDETSMLTEHFPLTNADEFIEYSFDFDIDAGTGAVKFIVGGHVGPACFDDVLLTVVPGEDNGDVDEAVEIVNQDFEDGDGGWFSYDNVNDAEAEVVDGAFCFATDTQDPWDAGMGVNGLEVPAGVATLTFDAKGAGDDYVVAVQVPDNTPTFSSPLVLEDTDEFVQHSFEFDVPAGENAAVKFEVGGTATPVCIDNVVLSVVPSDDEDDEDEALPSLTPGVNLVRNGDFSNGFAGWGEYPDDSRLVSNTDDGMYCATVSGELLETHTAALTYSLELPPGDYMLTFDASTEKAFGVVLQKGGAPYTPYAGGQVSGEEMTTYELPVSVPEHEGNGQLAFQLGPVPAGESYDLCIDNVFIGEPSVEYAADKSWDEWQLDGAEPNVDGDLMCIDVPAGATNPWDVNLHLDPLDLKAGPYTLSFEASGTGGPMRALVGQASAPYDVFPPALEGVSPAEEMTEYVHHLEVPYDHADSQIAFHLGGSTSAWTFCIQNVSLKSGGEADAYVPETGPAVKVNQHGYETDGPKRATLVTDATDALTWELVNANTEAITASGQTKPFGEDPSAGENVHVINFDGDHAAGTYTLRVGDDVSHPFTIANAQYSQLRYDALNYFYLARSGIEIEASIVGEEYARGAGHVSQAGGSDTNQGDYNVACQPAEDSAKYYGEAWTCDYTLDVVGGWYDAGDHGKYVVNGGVSVAQVMGTYERLLRASESDRAAMGDNTLNLPETGNGVPDALDEARWQLDFMTSMIVPDGKPLEGMVHHKIHDFGWTGLPLLPENGSHTRYLHRPSTAATLNLSATAAQGARLWEQYDPGYAAELLGVAESTWAAALANPELYAPQSDGDNGGGPYDDDDVTDEFYWAAAELFITTGDSKYEQFLLDSPVHTEESFMGPGLSWFELGAVAKINLATVDNEFSDRAAIAQQVITAGKAVRDIQRAEPFGQPMAADGYDWGSSSEVLNAIVIMGAAYDLTGDASLLAASLESMDYMLGRNALGQSYITDYGTQFSKNQHSRWFSKQLNSELPHPPPGTVAGGPNRMAETWDPVFKALYPNGDCAPQKCYVDHIESWATNEITINWNSALSAAVGFLASPDAPATVPDTPGNGGGGTPGDITKPPLTEDEVKQKDDGGIEVPATAYPGDTITIKVGTAHAGTATVTYIYSDGTLIGQSVVDADGNIRVTIPLDTTPGLHTIAVYDTDGNLIGWDTIEILAAADGSLPVTGAEGFITSVLIALLLVLAGVTLVLRRQSAE